MVFVFQFSCLIDLSFTNCICLKQAVMERWARNTNYEAPTKCQVACWTHHRVHSENKVDCHLSFPISIGQLNTNAKDRHSVSNEMQTPIFSPVMEPQTGNCLRQTMNRVWFPRLNWRSDSLSCLSLLLGRCWLPQRESVLCERCPQRPWVLDGSFCRQMLRKSF